MTESDYNFKGYLKREAEEQTADGAAPPVKRRRPEPRLTRGDLDQIAPLVVSVVRQYDDTIAENVQEFGLAIGELPPGEFEFHLLQGQNDSGFSAGSIDFLLSEFGYGSSQPPASQEAGESFHPETATRTATFMGASREGEDVVMSSYPEEIVSSPPEEIGIEEDNYAYALAKETGEQPEKVRAAETDEELDEDYIDQAAEAIISEALSELLDEVIIEIKTQPGTDDLPDAQVLRWLIRGDARISELLNAASVTGADQLKEAIASLSRNPVMVER